MFSQSPQEPAEERTAIVSGRQLFSAGQSDS